MNSNFVRFFAHLNLRNHVTIPLAIAQNRSTNRIPLRRNPNARLLALRRQLRPSQRIRVIDYLQLPSVNEDLAADGEVGGDDC